MSDLETKLLLERLQMHPDNKTKGAMQRDGLKAADTIARLEAERDAARREAMEECAAMLDAEHGRSKHMHNYAAVYARAIREAMEKP